MDQEKPRNNIRVKWRYADRSPLTIDSFLDTRPIYLDERKEDVTIGCSTTVFDYIFREEWWGNSIEGKTLVPCGLGEVALIMLDLHITFTDTFSLETWNNRKRLYRYFELSPQNGYIHQWELDKSKWIGSCPRGDKHGERSGWLWDMSMLAKQGKRMGGVWRRVCEYGADAVNDEPFWRIQLV